MLRSSVAALGAALLLALGVAGPASAAPADRVVITGGTTVAVGETAHDVVVIDGPVTIDGRVRGNVIAISGRVVVRGIVDGDVTAVAGRSYIGPQAWVGGEVRYAEHRPVVASGAQVRGAIRHQEWWTGAPWSAVGALALWLAVSLSTLALGLVLLWLAPGVAAASLDVLHRRAGAVAATGVIELIAVPMAAVAAMATFVGLPLGLLILLALLPAGAIAYVAGAHLLGRLMLPRGGAVAAFLAGWGVLRIVAIVPGGGLAGAIAVILGLGALTLLGWERRAAGRARRAGPPPVPGVGLPASRGAGPVPGP